MTDTSWGLYVHFPWCVAKCPYCDFNSHPLRGTLDADAYIAALLADFRGQVGNEPITPFQTIFLGGGTPSLLPPDAFAQLFEGLAAWLAPNAEITMEANPGSREHWDFAGYRQAGINRLSIGAQSFAADQLHKLGRIHQASDTERAFNLAREAGFENINLDLMYALPGQTTAEAEATIANAYAGDYLINPDISIQVARNKPFYILGEVQVPGRYNYEHGMTIINAVALAGGYTYRAKQDQAKILTPADPNAPDTPTETTTKTDAYKTVTTNTPITPGDVIIIKERWF